MDCAYLESFDHLSVQLLISWGGFLLEKMACDILQTGNPIHPSLSRCSLTKSSSGSCFMSQNAIADKRRAKRFLFFGYWQVKSKGLSGTYQTPWLCTGCCLCARSKGSAGVTPETIQPLLALKTETHGNNGDGFGCSQQYRIRKWNPKLSRVSTGVLTTFPIHLISEHRPSHFELQHRKPQQEFFPVNGRKPLLVVV